MNGSLRKWLFGIMTAGSLAMGGWYGKVVWSHENRITRTETRVEAIHETLQDIKNTLTRVDRRTERLWERARRD